MVGIRMTVQTSLLEDSPETMLSDTSFQRNKELPVHRWIPWIAGYSHDFVESVLARHINGDNKLTVLDPFCGVGTTLVSAVHAGLDAVGFEINPYAALASRVKANSHLLDEQNLRTEIDALKKYYAENSNTKPKSAPPEKFRTRIDFFSPRVLKKVLIIKDFVESIEDEKTRDLFRLALGSTLVQYSNYSYEPSLSTREAAGKSRIEDYDVLKEILIRLNEMREDIRHVKSLHNDEMEFGSARVIADSFFNFDEHLDGGSVDVLITSPPYINNYHYIRNTRPQLFWLDFVACPSDLKDLEHANYGKYWQTVRGGDDLELDFVTSDGIIEERIEEIRKLNAHKGTYGGSGWANYVVQYLNDSHKFVKGIKHSLKQGGTAYVVLGNHIIQGVHIPTDEFFAEISKLEGLEVVEIHIPRTERVGNSITRSSVRVGKAKKNVKLYEAVVEVKKA